MEKREKKSIQVLKNDYHIAVTPCKLNDDGVATFRSHVCQDVPSPQGVTSAVERRGNIESVLVLDNTWYLRSKIDANMLYMCIFECDRYGRRCNIILSSSNNR